MDRPSTERFSDRVANYVRYRPDYPQALIDYLSTHSGLSGQLVVADIGSGTGIFTRHLLDAGYKVFAVEPNEPMRASAEQALSAYPGFVSVDSTASHTGLEVQVIDLIVCAQAFHWYNTPETKAEFQRILKEDGYVALIWNNRIINADTFAVAYEALLQACSSDYKDVNHQNLSETDFRNFFRDGKYERVCFPNEQVFDEAGLIGRAFSSSYVPAPETEAGRNILQSLREMFIQFQHKGCVRFSYQTELYLGRL